MNLMTQNMKRLLSGVFAGGGFFCVCAQDVAIDNFSTIPEHVILADHSLLAKENADRLLEFGKVFSLRMLSRGKATSSDINNILRLLERDPDSMQLNVMLQNMLSRVSPQLRKQTEQQYCDLAEKNPTAWIMQTFSAEMLIRDKKTLHKGINQLYRVFRKNLLDKGQTSVFQQKDLDMFRQTLISRLLLLSCQHKRMDQYNVLSEFIRKDPHYRKQLNLLTDWFLASSEIRKTAGPLPLLPGNVIPGKELTVLRNFYTAKGEIFEAISKGRLPSGHKCLILLSICKYWDLNAELEHVLLQNLKTGKKRQWLAYVLLGDLIKVQTKKDLIKQASYYQNALKTGLTYYDNRALKLVGIYLDLRELKQAEQLLGQISKKAPKVNTIFHYIALYSARKDYRKALAKIALLPESFIRFRQEAYVRVFMGDYPGAYKAVNKAWREVKKRKIKFRDHSFLFLSVEIAEKCKDIRRVKALLEPAIRKNPGDMNLKNTLGYILADHNTDLQRAYVLLKEVVAVEPANGAFLDSMAWVLYRLKRYEEAKKYILLSLKHHAADRVVLDHAGDIFYALKDYVSAAKYWRLALGAKGEVKTETIVKKLKKLQLDRKQR